MQLQQADYLFFWFWTAQHMVYLQEQQVRNNFTSKILKSQQLLF